MDRPVSAPGLSTADEGDELDEDQARIGGEIHDFVEVLDLAPPPASTKNPLDRKARSAISAWRSQSIRRDSRRR
ncbi:hypothetical protein OG819_40195 [Streptomyces sp. NBC_01549]|uniref:hypothetical protein n=1 Tax=Streptomyces sp. NBC_01549 TaxID=2975874 RepID=UPI002252076F|nr:hypothetical protein [Streptomyces sp. NBC_01549]MCX4595670.1 hypothetical protein [Streptomyces sp. NBC_01549]